MFVMSVLASFNCGDVIVFNTPFTIVDADESRLLFIRGANKFELYWCAHPTG